VPHGSLRGGIYTTPLTTSFFKTARQPRLVDQVRAAVRIRHYSRSTAKAYSKVVHVKIRLPNNRVLL